MAAESTSLPQSQSSSRASSRPRSQLSLDLSDLPPLFTPSPPSNTLIVTVRSVSDRQQCYSNDAQGLDDIDIFSPDNLQTIRSLIDQHAPIHTWSPLKSFRRIIIVFYDVEAAKNIRRTLDGELIFGSRVRVYFGLETDTSAADQHLRAPHTEKLFFISPPPSPPHGWEIRNEEPPNKEVLPDDLALALARLQARSNAPVSPDSPGDAMDIDSADVLGSRKRSGSVIVYHPEDHGDSPNLPAISVEDLTDEPSDVSLVESNSPRLIAHTMRPPIELMEQ